jgi:flagellin
MDALDTALTSINSYMGSVGSFQNRLQYTINNLTTSIQNYTSSQSTIQDVDMASEVSTFTKNQILQQTGMAMLAQANSMPQSILTLLQH